MALAGPPGLAGLRGARVGEDRGEVALGEAARESGLTERAVDDGVTVQPGQLNHLTHLGPHPAGTGGGGSVSHNAAPSPRARNAASAAVFGRRTRSSAPAGAGGKCASSTRGLPGW